jgi:hypothetical protein
VEIKVSARVMVDIKCDCGARILWPADRLMAGETIPCECGRAAELEETHIETAARLARTVLACLRAATNTRAVLTLDAPRKPGAGTRRGP